MIGRTMSLFKKKKDGGDGSAGTGAAKHQPSYKPQPSHSQAAKQPKQTSSPLTPHSHLSPLHCPPPQARWAWAARARERRRRAGGEGRRLSGGAGGGGRRYTPTAPSTPLHPPPPPCLHTHITHPSLMPLPHPCLSCGAHLNPSLMLRLRVCCVAMEKTVFISCSTLIKEVKLRREQAGLLL